MAVTSSEAGRYFRDEMREYLKAKPINSQLTLRTRILEPYTGINEFKH
jgi:hypothetical protein